MASTDETLQRYINKMLQMQNAQRERPLSAEELKEIALDIGMSEEEWQASQQAAQDYLASGKTLLSYGSWQEAAKQLEQARNIIPYDLEVNHSLAKALTEYWKKTNNEKDKQKAQEAIQSALAINPSHAPTLALIRDMEREQTQESQKKRQLYITLGAIALGVVVLFGAVYFSLQNSIVGQQEDAKNAWAQVENVFDRRASLIPQLLSVAKSQLKAQKVMFSELEKAHESVKLQSQLSELSEAELVEFKKAQDELSKALTALMEKVTTEGKGQIGDVFYDLKVDIAGSENRIRVEIKRYNEAINKYNRVVGQFPYSLFGFETMPYYKGKSDKSTPKINFD